MARQFVCKSDGRSTIKNSGLRKFDPVRAFLKVSRELLSFFSLSLSHLSFSDPTTMILVPILFFFFFFFSNVTKFVYLILIEKKRRIFERNIVAQ